MAGVACGRALADSGLSPVLLDKGRRPGGRMSTRQAGDFAFDHGAQFFTVRGADFGAAVQEAESAGAAARWEACDIMNEPRYVGRPGMNGLVEHLAQGLDVRSEVEISAIARDGAGWLLKCTEGQQFEADVIVCTTPAPQAADFFPSDHPFQVPLSGVRMAPCWALLLGFHQPFAPGWQMHRANGPLSWVACNSSKPERSPNCWVVHASPDWSERYLEIEKPDAAERLSGMLVNEFGPIPEPVYMAGHRWRYAMVTAALGKPFLRHETVFLGGDWALGPRVECAFDSGLAIARAILAPGDEQL